jgi:hypothetical protein
LAGGWSSFLPRRRQRCGCFLCEKRRGEGDSCHSSGHCRSFVVGCHVTGSDVAPASCVKKGDGEGSYCLPGLIWTVTTTCVVTVWTTWHVKGCARSSPSVCWAGDVALSSLSACAVAVEGGQTTVARGSGDGVCGWMVVMMVGENGLFVCKRRSCGSGVNCLVTYLWVTPRVYPYPRSRVRVYVGSGIPYSYPCTPGVSQTLAQHYIQVVVCVGYYIALFGCTT